MTQRQSTDHVGHEAKLLVWVVLLIQEVLIGLGQALLTQCLLLPAKLRLQADDVFLLAKLCLTKIAQLPCCLQCCVETLLAIPRAKLTRLLRKLLGGLSKLSTLLGRSHLLSVAKLAGRFPLLQHVLIGLLIGKLRLHVLAGAKLLNTQLGSKVLLPCGEASLLIGHSRLHGLIGRKPLSL